MFSKRKESITVKPVLIIAAVPQETVLLEQTVSNTKRKRGIPFDYVEALLGSVPIIISVAGIGKVNAAAATSAMIQQTKPGLVINTGCAGAYSGSGLSIGSLAVASHECLGDEGVYTSTGWHDMAEIAIPTLIQGARRFYNELPLSKHAAEKAMQLADYYGVPLTRGKFITVSTCSGTKQRGEELAHRYNGICENMEGAAVAQICLRYGVDCLEIRGISNLVEERNLANWDIPRAVEAAQRFVLKYIEEMGRPEITHNHSVTVEQL